MSYTYNQSVLMGRLTKDPEFQSYDTGKEKLKFTLAVNRPYKNQTTQEHEADFIPITLWGTLAQTGKTLLKKGSPALIWGRLQIREYDSESDSKNKPEKKWITEVIAENFQILETQAQYETRINIKQS